MREWGADGIGQCGVKDERERKRERLSGRVVSEGGEVIALGLEGISYTAVCIPHTWVSDALVHSIVAITSLEESWLWHLDDR